MAETATIASASAPPPRQRFSRLLSLLVLAAAFVGLGAAAAPWLFSTNALQKNVLAQIQQITGLAAVSQGHSVFVVLPQPHISIDSIKLADPTGALRIEARYLKGYLRVAALLQGRLEIASATLGEPDMAIDLDGRPMPDNSAIGRAAQAKAASPQAGAADEVRLGVVSLVNGRARLTSRLGPAEILIEAINVTVDWRKLGAAASVTGTASFRGESADIAAVIAQPSALLRGEQSPLSLKIEGPALTLTADGNLASAPGARFAGRLAAAAPSLRKLVETGGYFVELPAPFENFSWTSAASIGADSASFSDLHFELDGNQYEGALAITMDEKKPVLSGTLAAGALSLRPFIAGRAPALGRDGQWSRDPFDLDWQSFADLDLRLSATRLTLPDLDLDDAAFSVMNRKDRLEIALIEAKAYQGALKGKASFARTDAGVDMRASATATDVDIAAVWPNASESLRVAGALSATGAVESAGASMSDLMRNLNGHVQVAIQRGEIGGVNLDQALRFVDKRPLGLGGDIRYGGTAFDRAGFGLQIARGVAEIDEGASMHSQTLDVAFKGSIDLGERALEVHAAATAVDADPQPGREPAKFDFDLAGPFDDIAITPDAQSLIRQSGAAAPLFSPNRLDPRAAPAAEGH